MNREPRQIDKLLNKCHNAKKQSWHFVYLDDVRKNLRVKQELLDDLADGKDYASLKREAEDRSMWKIRQ